MIVIMVVIVLISCLVNIENLCCRNLVLMKADILFILVMENRHTIYPYGVTGFKLLLWNIAFLLGVFFTRILLLNMVAHIFNQRKLFREYLYHMRYPPVWLKAHCS